MKRALGSLDGGDAIAESCAARRALPVARRDESRGQEPTNLAGDVLRPGRVVRLTATVINTSNTNNICGGYIYLGNSGVTALHGGASKGQVHLAFTRNSSRVAGTYTSGYQSTPEPLSVS